MTQADTPDAAASRPWKRPQSVLVLICTRGGDVLLLERTRPHGFWQSVTGSLQWGETAKSAACRELFEETGLRAGAHLRDLHRGERFPIVPPWRERYAPGVRCNREHWFVFELGGRRTIRLDPAEHRQYRWLPAAVAARRATSWTNRKLIRQWIAGQARR
ncbi:MAG: dihydroneopterin triphosphate diphosphatase [Gammaproteobacteria bacterium]|nr:dihydroneopterin triphosphate diphosphatase [Gammaproteobacteria bacterium]